MKVSDLLRATSGRLLAGSSNATFTKVSTDTRQLQAGDLFVALSGDNFEGDDFVTEAVEAGATAVLCGRNPKRPVGSAAIVVTDDSRRALGDLAAFHRRRFELPVVAVTGSNGKTTTKELLRSILCEAFAPEAVLANPGNFNNLIGMPLTLLRLSSVHRVAVLEMGMNRPGEIARLTEIARPSVGLITTIGSAHLEGVGSLEGVARAKGELFSGLDADAVAVVNAADPRIVSLAAELTARKSFFGAGAEIRAENVVFPAFGSSRFQLITPAGSVSIDLPLAGRHNVDNAVAAAACAMVLGVDCDDVARGLARAKPPPMRLDPLLLPNGVMLINDSYNANPDSVTASLNAVVGGSRGRCIVVLGDMRELGEAAEAEHRRVGAAAAAVRPALLCTVGDHASAVAEGALDQGLGKSAVVVCADHAAAADAVAACWCRGDTVLVKGSRGSAMEKVVESLKGMAV